MAKKVGESDRILISWSNGKNGRVFFITHRYLPNDMQNPIPSSPEDLQEKITKVADIVDGIRHFKRSKK